jgi:GDP-4-dehydro-6-deoxy-D-mannose reductase
MTKKILVTGASGFVGRHLILSLRSQNAQAEIIATSRMGGTDPDLGKIERLNVTDEIAVGDIIRRVRPTHVVHLAGMAAIPSAMAQPDAAWHLHLFGTLNLGQAITLYVPGCVLIHAGTGQVYGASAKSGLPLDESTLLAPTDTYTASKAAGDLALGAMAEHGLRCIRFRPFNHIGPDQAEDFVVASFAMQIARIRAGHQRPLLLVGNLNAARDFVDVRDVAAAYALAVERAEEIPSGSIFNLASGVAHRIQDVLEKLIALAGVHITIEGDPRRMRVSDIPVFVGNAQRARTVLGWEPKISFDQTLNDILSASYRSVDEQFPGDGKQSLERLRTMGDFGRE